jgi:hypothetical protein
MVVVAPSESTKQPTINIVIANVSTDSINIEIGTAIKPVSTRLNVDQQVDQNQRNALRRKKKRTRRKSLRNNDTNAGPVSHDGNNVQGMFVPYDNIALNLSGAMPVYVNQQSLVQYNEWFHRQNQMRESRQRRRS